MKDVALRMPARDARRVLLVHALEDADRVGEVLDLELRRSATRDAVAGRAGKDPSRWLAKRAKSLVAELTGDGSPLQLRVRRLLRWSDPLRGLVWPIVIVAVLVGLASNVLGPERRVNLLAPPLLALIVWNLAVFGLLAVHRVLGFIRPAGLSPKWMPRWEGWMRRFAGDQAWEQDFLAAWIPAGRPLASSRMSRTLHLAALAMVAGVIGGMYLRGLVLAYQGTWESTFLRAEQVDGLLGIVLGPAATLLGTGVPEVAPLEAPAAGPAGPWIHLWAVTAGLLVALPRGLLAIAEGLASWRAARRMEIVLPAAYPKRLRASSSASTPEVQVVPFSYRPTEVAVQSLRDLLQDLAGARAHVRFAPSLEYGSEAPDTFGGTMRVILFNLAQTPELEVHGEVLRRLREELPDGQGLLVLVDEGPLRRKAGALATDVVEERLSSRRRAWQRVVEGEDLAPVLVDLEFVGDVASRDRALDAMGGALWPPRRREELAWSA